MGKIFGFAGKMKGKVGNVVFRIRRGTQVMSQYNPEVDNPNTDKQVAARSRMKLMSQLAAIYAKIIAMPRVGAVTSRNLFTKTNYPLSSANSEKAIINLPKVQLTKSAREMPAFTVTRSSGVEIQCALIQAANFSRVVYAVVAKNANENLRVFASAVVENTENVENTFAVKLPYTAEAIVVYAYGVTDNNNRATTSFGNIKSPTAEEMAQLITSRSLMSTDYSVTATGGAYLEVGTTDAVSDASTGIGGGSQTIPTVPTIGGYSPFAEFTDVVLNAQNGASIFYTLNGTTPTTSSTEYREPIRITETTTVKAIAVMNGISSNVSTRIFTKEDAPVVVVPPTINGTTPFNDSTTVTMTAEEGARIYYTLDGTEPTTAGTAYDPLNPIVLTATTTVKAAAYLQNTLSAVTTRTFTKGTSGDDPFAG